MSTASDGSSAFIVNGATHHLEVPPLKRLLDVLREDLALTGTKEGCSEGECGSCSVLVGGKVVNACLVAACQVVGEPVETIEGPGFEALQAAFLDEGGVQCGICTPGLVIMARAHLDQCAREGREVTWASACKSLAGNLCRCTGYGKVIASVLAAADSGKATGDGAAR